jgi:hypothetical protein
VSERTGQTGVVTALYPLPAADCLKTRRDTMLKKLMSFAAVAGLVLALAPAAQADIIADLRTDYDAGLTGISIGNTTATHTIADTAGPGQWDFYSNGNADPDVGTPSLLTYDGSRFRTGTFPYAGGPIFGGGAHATLGLDELAFHPGEADGVRTVMAQWTAGAAYSDVSIDGDVRLVRWENSGGNFNGIELFIYHNGTQVGSTKTVAPLSTSALTFSNVLTIDETIANIADGDTITFSIDHRSIFWVDDTGLVATISHSPIPIPEPTSFTLAALGLVGLVGCRRRRNRA